MSHILWRLSEANDHRFQSLAQLIAELGHDSDEAHAIRDEIRSLPGYPVNADEFRDVIHREITTVR